MASEATDKKQLKEEKRKAKEDKKEKKEKKEKKRSETDGVVKDKKDKKKDKAKQDKLVRALDAHLQADAAATSTDNVTDVPGTLDPEDLVKPTDELVPFALPLADDKAHKKIYKLIKKGARLKAIHRGVKECEKSIKKSPLKSNATTSSSPPGFVVIAGDISPMDVIMHFPILCEEHGIPYIFVRSRADLGVAACTKRATSVVMLRPEGKKGKAGEDAQMEAADDGGDDKKVDAEEYLGTWKELVKLAEKQWTAQVEPWVKGAHPLQRAAAVLGSGH